VIVRSPGCQIDVSRIVSKAGERGQGHLRVGADRAAVLRGVLGRADEERLRLRRSGVRRDRRNGAGERNEQHGDEHGEQTHRKVGRSRWKTAGGL
jgi:hypothetical protein